MPADRKIQLHASDTGVIGDVPPRTDYFGYPARPRRQALRDLAQATTFVDKVIGYEVPVTIDCSFLAFCILHLACRSYDDRKRYVRCSSLICR